MASSILDLEEFALSESLQDTELGDSVKLESEGIEQQLAEKSELRGEEDALPDEDEVEELLSAKLMNGFMLIERPCPKCMIPLVKKPTSGGDISSSSSKASSSSFSASEMTHARIVTNLSIESLPKPLKGIPYCVSCQNCVVTNQAEIRLLETMQANQIMRQNGDGVESIRSTENSLNTQDLLSLGDHMVMKRTDVSSIPGAGGLDSPSAWIHSPGSTHTGNSSFLFKAAFSMHQKKRRNNVGSPISRAGSISCSDTKDGPLQGKRLVGKAASQDEGVEMNLEVLSVGLAESATNSVAPSLNQQSPTAQSPSAQTNTEQSIAKQGSETQNVAKESRDDDVGVEALWHFVDASYSTAREQNCELSLADKTFDCEPNFGISESLDSEHGGDCTETEEDDPTSLTKHFAAQEALRIGHYDADREEDDYSGGSEMEIVSHSIHYIETDHTPEKKKDSKELHQLVPKPPRTKSSRHDKKMRDLIALTTEEEKEEIEESNQEAGHKAVAKAPPPINISSADSDKALEQTLAMEKERLKLGKSSTAETEEVMTLEDMYCSKGQLSPPSVNKEHKTFVGIGSDDDSNTLLQQQLEQELKINGLGESDSILKDQPGFSMLEGLSSDSHSSAEIAAALDKIEKATLTILEEVKAKGSREDSTTAGATEAVTEKSLTTGSPSISAQGDQVKQVVREAKDVASIAQSISGCSATPKPIQTVSHSSRITPSTITENSKPVEEVVETGSKGATSTLTATAESTSKEEDDIMQEYTVRREIATKVLGTKMLQGYKLRESQCDQCGMPQMEYQSIVHCVVCPVLARKAKKELRKMQRLKEKGGESVKEAPIENEEEAIIDRVLQQHEEASTASNRTKQSLDSQQRAPKTELSPNGGAKNTTPSKKKKNPKSPSNQSSGSSKANKYLSLWTKEHPVQTAATSQSSKGQSFEDKAEELRRKISLQRALSATQKSAPKNPNTIGGSPSKRVEQEKSTFSEGPRNSKQAVKGEIKGPEESSSQRSKVKAASTKAEKRTKASAEGSKMEKMSSPKALLVSSLAAQGPTMESSSPDITLEDIQQAFEKGQKPTSSSSRRPNTKEVEEEGEGSKTSSGDSKSWSRSKVAEYRHEPPIPSGRTSKLEAVDKAMRKSSSLRDGGKQPSGKSITTKKTKVLGTDGSKKQDIHNEAQAPPSQSHSSMSDSELCVASKAPTSIKSADERRKELEAEEKSLLEGGRVAKEAAKQLLMKGGGLDHEEQARRKAHADREEELRKDQLKLIVETKRLETMERMRLANEIEFKSPQESLLAVFALQEERKRLRKEALRQKEIQILEEARRIAEFEAQRKEGASQKDAMIGLVVQEAKRTSEDSRKGATKVKESEGTGTDPANIKEAGEDMYRTREDLLAQVIAQGDADTVAETEANLRSQAEDYCEEKILPSASFLWRERWETLRLEGRSVMTRRLIAGWTMLPKYCKGIECQGSPLLMRGGRTECVVCGGSGTGKDGAYASPPAEGSSSDEGQPETSETPETWGTAEAPTVPEISLTVTPPTSTNDPSLDRSKSSTCNTSKAIYSDTSTSDEAPKLNALEAVQQIHEDFEEKRRTVSKEIGKRMLQGWTLLDMSCPNCVMPLLTDEEGENQICVLCGVVGKLKGDDPEENQFKPGNEHAERLPIGCEEVQAPDCFSDKAVAELSQQTTAFIREEKAKLTRMSQQFVEERHKEIKEKCGGQLPEGVYAMHENCVQHGRNLNEFAKDTGTAVVSMGAYLKENETVLSIGKHFEKTGAFMQQPGVDLNGVVAMIAETPCSPKAAVEANDCTKEAPKREHLPAQQKLYAISKSFSLASLDSGLADLGVTSSLSVPDFDEAHLRNGESRGVQKSSLQGAYSAPALEKAKRKRNTEELPPDFDEARSLLGEGRGVQKSSLQGVYSAPSLEKAKRKLHSEGLPPDFDEACLRLGEGRGVQKSPLQVIYAAPSLEKVERKLHTDEPPPDFHEAHLRLGEGRGAQMSSLQGDYSSPSVEKEKRKLHTEQLPADFLEAHLRLGEERGAQKSSLHRVYSSPSVEKAKRKLHTEELPADFHEAHLRLGEGRGAQNSSLQGVYSSPSVEKAKRKLHVEELPPVPKTAINAVKVSTTNSLIKEPTTKTKKQATKESPFESLAQQLKNKKRVQVEAEFDEHLRGPCPTDEETFASIDSMQPIADPSVVIDAKPSSPRKEKGLKKGAAAVALERLKGKKEQKEELETNEKKSYQSQAITRSFSASARPRGVLKTLTIDTSSPNESHPSPKTPMTPRSPTKNQKTPTASDSLRSSPRHGKSSPHHGKLSPLSSPRKFSPRNAGSPAPSELHDRLQQMLAKERSPTNGHNSRPSKSAPNSPTKRSQLDGPDYLINVIAGRRPGDGKQYFNGDPPAMIENHVVGRRVARDPEDRSLAAAEDASDAHSISSRSHLGTPNSRPKSGPSSRPSSSPQKARSPSPRLLSPSKRSSPYPESPSKVRTTKEDSFPFPESPTKVLTSKEDGFLFPESPTKVRKTKEDEEGVTLVIPKDFDVTNDSQLRDLILAAKQGALSSPANNRLALQGRIKQMGGTEVIDVIDLQLSDEDFGSTPGDPVIGMSLSQPHQEAGHHDDPGGPNSLHLKPPLKVDTRDQADDDPQFKHAMHSPSSGSSANFGHAPSPGEQEAVQPRSLDQSPNNARASQIVVSRMHPPSPGESPFNGKPAARRRRPKVTPESMVNRTRPNRSRPKPTPTGVWHKSINSSGGGGNHTFTSSRGQATTGAGLTQTQIDSSPGQASLRSRLGSRSSGSGSSINPDKASPDQLFSSGSASTKSHNMGNVEEHRAVLTNVSFSESSGSSSRYSHYTGNSASRARSGGDSVTTTSTAREATTAAAGGLPPISPRKRHSPRKASKRRVDSFSDREFTSGNESMDSPFYDTGATLSRDSSMGFETGVTSGRSSSFDRSTASSSRHRLSSSDSEQIRVLNSESEGGIEITRHRPSSRGTHRTKSPRSDSGSVKSTTFDGIINRIDTCKSKLKPSHAREGVRGEKMVALIEKLTRDAADVSTVAVEQATVDDDTIPSM